MTFESPLEIHPAAKADLPGLLHLYGQLAGERGGSHPADTEDAGRILAEVQADSRRELLVAVKDGRLLGTADAATAATGIIILRTRVLPVWLGWVGFAIAVLCLPAIPPLTFVAAILLGIWTVVISAFMLRAANSDIPAAP